MKKYILVTLLLIFPILVKAEGSININCGENKVSINDTITCSITGYTTEEVSGVHAEIEVESDLTLETVKVDSIWIGDNDKILDLFTDENKTGNFNIATITVKAPSEATNKTIFVNNIVFSNKDFENANISSASVDINIVEADVKTDQVKTGTMSLLFTFISLITMGIIYILIKNKTKIYKI